MVHGALMDTYTHPWPFMNFFFFFLSIKACLGVCKCDWEFVCACVCAHYCSV